MKIAIVLLAAALLVIGVVYGRAADRTDRTPVPSFDLARYKGTWYEIARYDHPFERGWPNDAVTGRTGSCSSTRGNETEPEGSSSVSCGRVTS